MAQGKALLGGHSKQQFLTNIDGLPPLQVLYKFTLFREREKKRLTQFTLSPQESVGFPSLSLLHSMCPLLQGTAEPYVYRHS